LPCLLPFIRRCAAIILINRNIDFSVFGSLISKVTPTLKDNPDEIKLRLGLIMN
jgi:hypothetical protein